jgi:hypothetical protein
MSSPLEKQGGRVQLEQSFICSGLNWDTIPKEGFLLTATQETQFLIMNPSSDDLESRKHGIKSPGHRGVTTTLEGHLAMVRENQMDKCLHYQNVNAMTPQICWWCKSTGAYPPHPCT